MIARVPYGIALYFGLQQIYLACHWACLWMVGDGAALGRHGQ